MSAHDTLPLLPVQDGVEFRYIVGFPGYAVGNDGSVWTSWHARGYGGGTHILPWLWRRKKLQTHPTSGHVSVTLVGPNGPCRRRVHLLVLEAFIGPRPPGMECCHFPDRNPANNRLINLRWDTPHANKMDAVEHGTIVGSNNASAKLTEADIPMIRAMRRAGVFFRIIADRFGVSESVIISIIQGKRWKHVPESIDPS